MEVFQWINRFDSKLVFIPLISIMSLIYCLIKDVVIEDEYQLILVEQSDISIFIGCRTNSLETNFSF